MQGLLLLSCLQLSSGAPPAAQVYTQGLSLVQVKAVERRADTSEKRSECHAGAEDLKHKVFVHSLPKTGTTSVGHALKLLGYKDCSWEPEQYYGGEDLPVNHRTAMKEARKLVEDLDPSEIPESTQEKVRSLLANFKDDVDHCQSFSDWPIGHATTVFPLALKNILWPNAHYIWVNRSFDTWYASLETMKMDQFNESVSRDEVHLEYSSLRDEANKFSRLHPNKMVLLDIEDPGLKWGPIVKFLLGENCSAPDIDFPVENVASDSSSSHVELPSSARKDVEERVADIPDNDPVSVIDYLNGVAGIPDYDSDVASSL